MLVLTRRNGEETVIAGDMRVTVVAIKGNRELRRSQTKTGAGVFVDEMLDDEQRSRPVVELFAPIHTNVDVCPAAALTDALGLGQLVMPGLVG